MEGLILGILQYHTFMNANKPNSHINCVSYILADAW